MLESDILINLKQGLQTLLFLLSSEETKLGVPERVPVSHKNQSVYRKIWKFGTPKKLKFFR